MKRLVDQDKVFLESEANEWFQRNAKAIHSQERVDMDIPLKMIETLPDLKPKRVLEIGCSNGYRLGQIQQRLKSECVGVEPSEAAIADGKKLFPKIDFRRGLAAQLPIQSDEQFDLVLVCFVLHWVGRNSLLQSIAEIDRVVEENGYLLVGDFLPDFPCKRNYHHLPGKEVFTYKQDYASIFLATGLYTQVSRVTFDQDTGHVVAHSESSRRGSHTLLRKIPGGVYIET